MRPTFPRTEDQIDEPWEGVTRFIPTQERQALVDLIRQGRAIIDGLDKWYQDHLDYVAENYTKREEEEDQDAGKD